MASIFKRQKGKNVPYTIQYVDHLGKRRTTQGFTDKGLSEQLAAKLESEARLRSSGMISHAQDLIANSGGNDINIHVTAFEKSLADNSEKYVSLLMYRVRRILNGCEFKTLGSVNSEDVVEFLETLREDEDLGHKTYNHYLRAIDTFLNWCVRGKRLASNPVIGAERLNTETDVRHQRRALSPDEVTRLVDTARSSDRLIQCLSAEQRARIYTIAYMTGLRKRELSGLSKGSFKLDDVPPTLTVEAAHSKHRKKDVLPLHPDLVEKLRIWTKGLKESDLLFSGLERKKLSVMVRKDLEAAGIAYETKDGIADFHAAGRHTYITQLIRSGVSLPAARELARHSDVNMTMRYTHIGIDDQAEALSRLPKIATPIDSAALHGRCIFGGVEGHSASVGGNGHDDQKRIKPSKTEENGIKSPLLSSVVKAEGTGIEPATPYGALHFQ